MDQIKEYRRDLYVMLVVMNRFQTEAIAKGTKISYSLAMARTSAQKARKWTGKVLSEMGIPSLYKGDYQQAPDIVPIADVTDVQFDEATGVFRWPDLGPLGFVSIDWRGLGNKSQKTMFLRKQIRKLIAYWTSYLSIDTLEVQTNGNLSKNTVLYLDNAWWEVHNYLEDTIMELDNVLGSLRDAEGMALMVALTQRPVVATKIPQADRVPTITTEDAV